MRHYAVRTGWCKHNRIEMQTFGKCFASQLCRSKFAYCVTSTGEVGMLLSFQNVKDGDKGLSASSAFRQILVLRAHLNSSAKRADTWDGKSTEADSKDKERDGDCSSVGKTNHQQQSCFHTKSCHQHVQNHFWSKSFFYCFVNGWYNSRFNQCFWNNHHCENDY